METFDLIFKYGVSGALFFIIISGAQGQWIYKWAHDAIVARLLKEIESRDEALKIAHAEISRLQSSNERYIALASSVTGLANKAANIAEASTSGNATNRAPG